MVDAVRPLATGAVASAPAAADDPAADGVFPAAMEHAMGRPSSTVSGKVLPAKDGSSSPVPGAGSARLTPHSDSESGPLPDGAPAVPVSTPSSPPPAPSTVADATVMHALEQVAEAKAVLPTTAERSGEPLPTTGKPRGMVDDTSLPAGQSLAVDGLAAGRVTPVLAEPAPSMASPDAQAVVVTAASGGTSPTPVPATSPAPSGGVSDAAQKALPASAQAMHGGIHRSPRRASVSNDESPGQALPTGQTATTPTAPAVAQPQGASVREDGAAALVTAGQSTATDLSKVSTPQRASARQDGSAALTTVAELPAGALDQRASAQPTATSANMPKTAQPQAAPVPVKQDGAIALGAGAQPSTTTTGLPTVAVAAAVIGNDKGQPLHADSVSVPPAAGASAGHSQAASLLVAPPWQPAAAALPPTAMELPVAARPGSPDFAGELGNRLIWLVNQGVQEARLQLNPRELGPIEVRLGFSDGAAQVSFNVQHAGTAAAVQQSLPQLRELLAQQGLQLGQAAVFQQNAGNADQAGQQASRQGWTGGGGVAHGLGGEDLPPVTAAYVIGRGLIDAYA